MFEMVWGDGNPEVVDEGVKYAARLHYKHSGVE